MHDTGRDKSTLKKVGLTIFINPILTMIYIAADPPFSFGICNVFMVLVAGHVCMLHLRLSTFGYDTHFDAVSVVFNCYWSEDHSPISGQ